MQIARSFDRNAIFDQINARRQQINRDMIYNREVGHQSDPSLAIELAHLADQEDALLGFGSVSVNSNEFAPVIAA